MKKLSLSIVLVLWGLSFLSAQKAIEIIPKFGLNFSYFEDNFDGESIDGKPGFQVGIDLRIGNKFYVEPGIYYLRQSNRFYSTDGLTNIGAIDIDYSTQGVRVPIMVGLDLFKADRIGIRAFGGPGFSIFFGEDDFFDSLASWERKDTNVGLDLGVGLDIGIITVDLQHEWGLNELVEWENVNSSSRAFFLTLGLLF